MRIPRIRLLRHWSRVKTGMRGYWLLLVEPRWPVIRFHYEESLDDFFGLGIFPAKQDDTLEVIVEHFDPTCPNAGDVREQLFYFDVFELMVWHKKCL